mgnify:CR=1 FL=1
MFLSQMALDLTQPETQTFIHSVTYARQQISSLFSVSFSTLLWRLDDVNGRIWLTLLSPWRPDFGPLHDKIGFQGVFPSWFIEDYTQTLENLNTNDRYDFNICVCPYPPENHQLSSQHILGDIYHWFSDQSHANGFQILSIHSLNSYWRMADQTYILYARIQGKLLITDPELFQTVLTKGIGFAKDSGAGLMTIHQII